MQTLTIVPSEPDVLFGVGDISQAGSMVTSSMSTGPVLGPDGRPAVGALGVLADNTLGYAVMADLPQGAWSISTEIWLDVIAPLDETCVSLTAEASVQHSGGFSQGHLRDTSGRVVAYCRQRGRQVEPLAQTLSPRPGDEPSRPDTPGCDLGELLGVRRVGDDHVLRVGRALLNPRGMLHGGVSLAASEYVATASRVARGSTLRTASVHIVHTRGVHEGASISFEAITRHSGRSLWVTEVVGLVQGKVSTVTTVTAQ